MTQDRRWRADIELLRAVAVCAVVAYHIQVPGFSGGFVGVDIFFVISGFLITGQLRASSGSMREQLLDFYGRRARRILPLSSLVLGTTLAWTWWRSSPLRIPRVADDISAAALFGVNVRFANNATDYFADDAATSPVQHFWSLAVEEQFYLAWPLLLGLLALVGRRHLRTAWFVALAAGVASLVLAQHWVDAAPDAAFYLVWSRAWQLGVGCALAFVPLCVQRENSPRWALPLTAAGALAIAVAVGGFDDATSFPGVLALVPTLGAAAVIGGGAHLSLPQWLNMPALLGRYSFGWYLWHWPILLLAPYRLEDFMSSLVGRSAVMVLFALPLAVLTYHLFENPIRRSAWLRDAPGSLLVGVAMVAVVILAAAGVTANAGSLSTDRPAAASAHGTIEPTDWVPSNLIPTLENAAPSLPNICRDSGFRDCDQFGPPEASYSVVLYGDSHAGHLVPAFRRVADELSLVVRLDGPGSCYSALGQRGGGCADLQDSISARMATDPPNLIVISTLTVQKWEADPSAWAAEVATTLDQLPAESQLIVISETPSAVTSVPECLALNLGDTTPCDVTWPEALNDELQAIAEAEGAGFIDLRDGFCTAQRCPTIDGNNLIYADADHVTAEYSALLGPLLASELAPFLDATP